MGEVMMPYGKFKGKKMVDLPTWYVKWVAENWREDTPANRAICKAADEEYISRGDDGL